MRSGPRPAGASKINFMPKVHCFVARRHGWRSVRGSRGGPGTQAAGRAGADPNARDVAGETPAHNAVSQAREDVLRVLLAGGADISVPDNDGMVRAPPACPAPRGAARPRAVLRPGGRQTALDMAREMDKHGVWAWTGDRSTVHRGTHALLREWDRALRDAGLGRGDEHAKARRALAVKLYGRGSAVRKSDLLVDGAVDRIHVPPPPEKSGDEMRRDCVRDVRALQRSIASAFAFPKLRDMEQP